MFDLVSITAIAGAFLLAGTVKGVIGLGLPTVSLGLLTAALDLTTAMALLIVPSFATNIWQATGGGNGRAIFRRIWSFLLMATASVWFGAVALSHADLPLLSALLGGLLVTYATINLAGTQLTIPPQREIWIGPLLGAVNGILTGMTGSFVMPGVMYLQAIGLPRDRLVQAMGILFTTSTVALALVLQGNNLLTTQLGLFSAAAVVPAAIGMAVGRRIRRGLSEDRFRRTLFIGVFVLGAYIIARAALGLA